MLASAVILPVGGRLQDLGATRRWPVEPTSDQLSMVDVLNSAIRAVCLVRPDAYVLTEAWRLEEGYLQTIPTITTHGATRNATRLFEIMRNMGADGATPGDPIFQIDRDDIKALGTGTDTVVDNYAYDHIVNPDAYYIYPGVQAGATVYVEGTYATVPDTLTASTDTFPLADIYAVAVHHWMLYEFLSGDTDDTNMAKAQHHFLSFFNVLQVKLTADVKIPVKIVQAQE